MQIKFKRGNQWISSMQGHKPRMSRIRHTVWSTTQANQDMNYLEWHSVEQIPLPRPNTPLYPHKTVLTHRHQTPSYTLSSSSRSMASILLMLRKQWKDSWMSPFIPIRIKSWWGLFWAGSGPPYNFYGKLSSFCVILLTNNQPTNKQTQGKTICPWLRS